MCYSVLCVLPLLYFVVHTFAFLYRITATIAHCGECICLLIHVQNNLPDSSIIQLYSKSTQSYLCIKKSGVVKESVHEKLSKKLCGYIYVPHANEV